MDDVNQPPPGEMACETQPAAAEMVGDDTQPPQADLGAEMQPPRMPACVSKVLDDHNLLAEIILRVGFPRTSLVRAAAVCRRWLLLASDRAFLRRFRKLHPPSLLGFYHTHQFPEADNFFLMLPQPPPPELAAVVRRASFRLRERETEMLGCWNGRVVTMLLLHMCPCVVNGVTIGEHRMEIRFVLYNPLCSRRGMTILPKLDLPFKGSNMYSYKYKQLFFKEEGNVLSYFFVRVESASHETKSTLHVSVLQNGDDAWQTHLTMTVDYKIHAQSNPTTLVDNKIYMASTQNEIVVLDLMASSVSTIQLPQGVDFITRGTTMLSRADDASAVYLIHAKELKLHIWLHKGGNWLLVDNICLREMCAPYIEAEPTAVLQINHVGDYTADFIFFQMGRFVLYLDVKCRTLRKVYETDSVVFDRERAYYERIYPFMMIWPPNFPALKDDSASNVPHEEQGQQEA